VVREAQRLVLGVQLLHVPVPLHLSLVPVDAAFHLASEGQEMLVDEFGGQAVASMLLGSLDMMVDFPLDLEPLVAALIRAGEGAQAGVIHQMVVDTLVRGKG